MVRGGRAATGPAPVRGRDAHQNGKRRREKAKGRLGSLETPEPGMRKWAAQEPTNDATILDVCVMYLARQRPTERARPTQIERTCFSTSASGSRQSSGTRLERIHSVIAEPANHGTDAAHKEGTRGIKVHSGLGSLGVSDLKKPPHHRMAGCPLNLDRQRETHKDPSSEAGVQFCSRTQ